MEPLKRLLSTHPLIFSLLGIALLLDLSGVMSSIMPGTSFALGSVFVFAYFLGLSGILRFTIARRPINLSLSWVAIVILYLGWFGIQAALNDRPYRPSLLFFLCVVAAFKTMRSRDTSTTTASEISPEPVLRDETLEADCLISSDDLPPPIPAEFRNPSPPVGQLAVATHKISAHWLPLTMAAWCVILIFAEFDSLWPYQLSQWAICSGSAILAFRFGPDTWRGVVACIIAILFNPIAPIHFGDAWPVIDCLAAIALIVISPNPSNFRKEDWIRRARALRNLVRDGFALLMVTGGAVLIVCLIWDIASGNMAKRDMEKAEAKRTGGKASLINVREGVNPMRDIPDSERMLLDFDGWLASQPEEQQTRIRDYANSTTDPIGAKKGIAMRYAVAQSTGIDIREVDDKWDLVRSRFAAERGGDWLAGVNDDAAFHSRLVKEAQFRRDVRQLAPTASPAPNGNATSQRP